MNNRIMRRSFYLLITGFFLFLGWQMIPPDPGKKAETLPPPVYPPVEIPEKFKDENLVLPKQSDRIASYTMNVKLDTRSNVISGTEVLSWKNNSDQALDHFPFHLYHNAWKNNISTFAREQGGELRGQKLKGTDYGYTNVKKIKVLADGYFSETDVTSTFEYIQPDDQNTDDQTVFRVMTPKTLPAGKTIRFEIEFETKQPKPVARTGAIRDYHFVAQWFPKIGVWWKGAWNCHQFHASTEFFADYGVYDVKITVPVNYIVGATGGKPKEESENGDGTKTLHFYQEDVHDFTWVTSPHLILKEETFRHQEMIDGENPKFHHPLKEVGIRLMIQPEHLHLADRYLTATKNSLRCFGEWYGEYPYDYVTVVDPAYQSRSGGMEYPTLFTGGTHFLSPRTNASPEGVTVHEFGHQFWYGLVGNNEFEEAWLDEGFNTYSTEKVLYTAWKEWKNVQRYFGIPFSTQVVSQERHPGASVSLSYQGKNDVMVRRGWEYNESYGLNSYGKPAMSLATLENYLGEELMYHVMRVYHHRFRFQHPTTQDFIRTVNEVTGKDLTWFFEQTWFSSYLFDYKIFSATSNEKYTPDGIFNFNGQNPDTTKKDLKGEKIFMTEVTVSREGEAVFPVEVLMVFEDGKQVLESWDGQYRWKKFEYEKPSRLKYAEVDPYRKLILDVNRNNNSYVIRGKNFISLATRRWVSKWMFWLQNYLEAMSFWALVPSIAQDLPFNS